MLAHIAEIAAATDLPVNADFESGYAHEPEGVAANVRAVRRDRRCRPVDRGFDRRPRQAALRPRSRRRAHPRRAGGDRRDGNRRASHRPRRVLSRRPCRSADGRACAASSPMRRRAPMCSTRRGRRSPTTSAPSCRPSAPKPVNVLVSSRARALGRRYRGPRRAPHQRRLGARPRRLGRLHARGGGHRARGPLRRLCRESPVCGDQHFLSRRSEGPRTGDIMTDRLKGKIAVVTAAGQGIGRAIAEAFVAEGAKVLATDLDREQARRARRAPSAQARRALERGRSQAFAREGRARSTSSSTAPGFVHHGTVLDCVGQGLGLLLRPQRQVDAPHDQGLPAGHAREGQRLDRQHRLRRVARCAASRTATSTAPPRRP